MAIPISPVIDFDSNVRLNIAKENVRDLSALDIARGDELPLEVVSLPSAKQHEYGPSTLVR